MLIKRLLILLKLFFLIYSVLINKVWGVGFDRIREEFVVVFFGV